MIRPVCRQLVTGSTYHRHRATAPLLPMPVLIRPVVRPIDLSERGEVDFIDVCGVLAEHLATERAVNVLERRDRAAQRLGEQAGGVREVGFEHAVVYAEPLDGVDQAWAVFEPKSPVTPAERSTPRKAAKSHWPRSHPRGSRAPRA